MATKMNEPEITNADADSEEIKDSTTANPISNDDLAKLTYKEIAKKNGINYTVAEVPPLFTSLLLGLQHYLTMLGATVLIPLILCPAMGANGLQTAEVISSIFFVSGINTVSTP
jgi:Permease family